MNRPPANPADLEIWCDKPSDRDLVRALQKVFPFLKAIPTVQVIPNRSGQELAKEEAYKHIAGLLGYDRPDLIFVYRRRPILAVELTEHGYTGDNPLQRFARVNMATERGVPFIHFTPFARTRLDELLVREGVPSARNVTSRLFEGFLRLTEIYGVPVVGVNWPVNEKGTPLKANLSDARQVRTVFGELMSLVERICLHHAEDILEGRSVLEDPEIKKHIDRTRAQAATQNIRDSEIRLVDLHYKDILGIIRTPMELLKFVSEKYFFVGKAHKLIALRGLQESRVLAVQGQDGRMHMMTRADAVRRSLPEDFAHKKWVVIYSGYEWRSEPNVGIVTNADILLSRSKHGKTVKDRDRFLAVVWPRAFFNGASPVRRRLCAELEAVEAGRREGALAELLERRRQIRKGRVGDPHYIRATGSSLGAWTEAAVVARIYRAVCDLVILNDAVLLGNHWIKS